MDTKTCTMCNIEKHMNIFYRKKPRLQRLQFSGGLVRFYEHKDKISNKKKIYYEKNIDKILLQKQNNRRIQLRDLFRSYVELENRIKSLEEKVDSEKNQNFQKMNRFLIYK